MVSVQPLSQQHQVMMQMVNYNPDHFQVATPPGTPSSQGSAHHVALEGHANMDGGSGSVMMAQSRPMQQLPQHNQFGAVQWTANQQQAQQNVAVSGSASDHMVAAAMQAVCAGPPMVQGSNMFMQGALTAHNIEFMKQQQQVDGSHRLTPSSDDQKSESAMSKAVNGRVTKKVLPQHLKKGKFPCDECDLMCKTENQLFQHKREHTGEKPHECEKCGRRFTRCDHLTRHIKNVHKEDADRLLPLNLVGVKRRHPKSAPLDRVNTPQTVMHDDEELDYEPQQQQPRLDEPAVRREAPPPPSVNMYHGDMGMNSMNMNAFELFTPGNMVPNGMSMRMLPVNMGHELLMNGNASMGQGVTQTQTMQQQQTGQIQTVRQVEQRSITPARPPSTLQCAAPSTAMLVTKCGEPRGFKKDGTARKKPGRKQKVPIELSLSEESSSSNATNTANTTTNTTIHAQLPSATNRSNPANLQPGEHSVVADLSNEQFHAMNGQELRPPPGSVHGADMMHNNNTTTNMNAVEHMRRQQVLMNANAMVNSQNQSGNVNVNSAMQQQQQMMMMGAMPAQPPAPPYYRPSNEQILREQQMARNVQQQQAARFAHHQQQQQMLQQQQQQQMQQQQQRSAQSPSSQYLPPHSHVPQQQPQQHQAPAHSSLAQALAMPRCVPSEASGAVPPLNMHPDRAASHMLGVVGPSQMYNAGANVGSVPFAQPAMVVKQEVASQPQQQQQRPQHQHSVMAALLQQKSVHANSANVVNAYGQSQMVVHNQMAMPPAVPQVVSHQNSNQAQAHHGVVKQQVNTNTNPEQPQLQHDGSYLVVRAQSTVCPSSIDLFQL